MAKRDVDKGAKDQVGFIELGVTVYFWRIGFLL